MFLFLILVAAIAILLSYIAKLLIKISAIVEETAIFTIQLSQLDYSMDKLVYNTEKTNELLNNIINKEEDNNE